jgi:hypothetical protein
MPRMKKKKTARFKLSKKEISERLQSSLTWAIEDLKIDTGSKKVQKVIQKYAKEIGEKLQKHLKKTQPKKSGKPKAAKKETPPDNPA